MRGCKQTWVLCAYAASQSVSQSFVGGLAATRHLAAGAAASNYDFLVQPLTAICYP